MPFCHRSVFFGFTADALLIYSDGNVVLLPTSKMLNQDGSITVGHTDNYLLKGLIFRRICASVRVFALG